MQPFMKTNRLLSLLLLIQGSKLQQATICSNILFLKILPSICTWLIFPGLVTIAIQLNIFISPSEQLEESYNLQL